MIEKVNIFPIISAHLQTLRDYKSENISKSDLTLFYGSPFCIAAFLRLSEFQVGSNVYENSVSVFGIFIALLLNVQVAVLSMMQREWPKPDDKKLIAQWQNKTAARNILIGEINANVSYVIVLSVFALIIFMLGAIRNWGTSFGPALLGLVYSHFMLNIVMIIRRTYAIFEGERIYGQG